jgi:heterodisulfide reductase subunit A
MPTNQALVIGAGIAGMEASLLLSKAGRRVHLVERSSITGGNAIRFEEVFSNMECATCMLAPMQQDILQDPNIELHTLSMVEAVEDTPGGMRVTVKQRAGYVDHIACIGCGACYDPCPVSVPNEFEMGLSQRKAIYIPCAGALPNVPVVDTSACLRFRGEDCQACKEACVFEAIDFEQQDRSLDFEVDGIIVAIGSEIFDPAVLPKMGYRTIDNVLTALEFERLFASNGPTEGEIKLKDGSAPSRVAIIHCVGRELVGYCSSVCCMYSLKFNHYLRSKLPGVGILELVDDLCIPGKASQSFRERMAEGTEMLRARDIQVSRGKDGISISFASAHGREERTVDMVVLAPAIVPSEGSPDMAKMLSLGVGPDGFLAQDDGAEADHLNRIHVVGCAGGPMDMQGAVTQAMAAVGRILALDDGGEGR